MRKLNLIANQVVQKNLRSWGWWLLVLAPLITLAVVVGISQYKDANSQKKEIAVVAPAPVTESLTTKKSKALNYEKYTSKKGAEKALEKQDVDGILIVSQTQKSPKLLTIKGDESVDQAIIQSDLTMINTAMVAQSLGLSQAQLSRLLTAPDLKKQKVSFDDGKMHTDKNKDSKAIIGISMAVGILMYGFLISYGSTVAQEIGTEKGSRIEESILTAIKAKTQFYGKLIGIAEIVMIHMLIYIMIGLILWIFKDQFAVLEDFINIIPWTQIDASYIWILALFLIVGIFTYTVLAALCGSIVSNQEQLGQATMPIIMLALIGYIGSIMVVDTSNIVLTIGSYTPFFSPMLMPVRFGAGQVDLIQAIISLLISVVFVIGFTLFSAQAYKNNVLIYNDSGLFKAIKKSLKATK